MVKRLVAAHIKKPGSELSTSQSIPKMSVIGELTSEPLDYVGRNLVYTIEGGLGGIGTEREISARRLSVK